MQYVKTKSLENLVTFKSYKMVFKCKHAHVKTKAIADESNDSFEGRSSASKRSN